MSNLSKENWILYNNCNKPKQIDLYFFSKEKFENYFAETKHIYFTCHNNVINNKLNNLIWLDFVDTDLHKKSNLPIIKLVSNKNTIGSL